MNEKKIRLKVCGMRDAGNIVDITSLQVDYVGFIFYRRSPRFVGDDFRLPLIPAHIQRVGVFVNESASVIADIVTRFGLHYVQLHGDESPALCESLRSRGIRLIKAFAVNDEMKFAALSDYYGLVDYFLFDAKGKYYGGNAVTFDWTLLSHYDQKTPFFLSGGITSENIESIRSQTWEGLHAIDVNSGAEVLPGMKDVGKVRSILQSLNSRL